MGSLWPIRPSGPLLISVVALIVAASGTAIAAGRLVSGDKLIARGSLSGDRLRKHTITALELNLARATVPNATGADHAATAGFATNATNATSATTATTAMNATNATTANTAVNATNATNAANAVNARNAATLEGQLPSAFVSSSDVTQTGLVRARAGHTVNVASFAPFTMTLVCWTNGVTMFAEIDVSSTEAGSLAAQKQLTTAGQPVGVADDSAPINQPADDDGNVFDFLAPSGKSYQGVLAFGENFFGSDCFANALIAQS